MTTSYIYIVMDERYNYDENSANCLGVGNNLAEAKEIQKQYPGSVIIKQEDSKNALE